MASSVTVHIVNIRVNTDNLDFVSGKSIFLMLKIFTVTLEAMQYFYIITYCTPGEYKTRILRNNWINENECIS